MMRIMFICATISLTVHGMEPRSGITENPEKLAQRIAKTIRESTDPIEPEAAIIMIRKFLKDDSLSLPQTLLVKESLVNILSTQIVECGHARVHDGNTSHQEIIRTVFYDETVSLEKEEYFSSLDKSMRAVLYPKPRSPWHNLSFEDFIQRYLSVRRKKNAPVPHLTDSVMTQQ